MTLDVARLSEDPQQGVNNNEITQNFQRAQASLTLPLNRCHHGTTITSAAMIHHNARQTPLNQQQHVIQSVNHPLDSITPTMDGAGGRLTLSTFSPSNPTFITPNSIQVTSRKLPQLYQTEIR